MQSTRWPEMAGILWETQRPWCQTSARFFGKKIWHNLRSHPVGTDMSRATPFFALDTFFLVICGWMRNNHGHVDGSGTHASTFQMCFHGLRIRRRCPSSMQSNHHSPSWPQDCYSTWAPVTPIFHHGHAQILFHRSSLAFLVSPSNFPAGVNFPITHTNS